MTRFNVHEAKTHLSKLLERVERGEEMEIARNGRVIAKLVPAEDVVARRRAAMGSWAGKVWIADNFDDPLPEDFLLRDWIEILEEFGPGPAGGAKD